MSNYTKILESVKDNISGSAEAHPGTKAGGAVLSSGSIAPFAFNGFKTGCGGVRGAAAPLGSGGGFGLFNDFGNDKPAFGENLPPHFGGGGGDDDDVVSGGTAELIISALKRECFRVIDIKKLAAERLVLERNNSNKLLKGIKKNKEVSYHKYCGTWTLLVSGKNRKDDYLFRYKCGSWRCPKCSVGLAQRQFMKIQSSLENFKNAVFFTLTFDPKKLNNSEAEEKEGKIWNQLNIYLERKIGKSEFYWSREWQVGTKMLHKHVLILNDKLFDICEGVYCKADRNHLIASKKGKYYDFKMWLESVIVGRGYGKICDVERPRNTDAIAKYLVKEITKTSQKKDDYRSNLRMHGNSRGFFKKVTPIEEQTMLEKEKKKEDKKEVYIIKGSIEAVKECLEINGFQTKDIMDNIVYEKNADGKIEAVGSELGSFSVENSQ